MDNNNRVLLLHCDAASTSCDFTSFTLPDPKGGRQLTYVLAGGRLQELNRFKQEYSTWIAGDQLLADGGMFVATPVDPLLVLLPFLDRGRDQSAACPAGMFKPLEELLYDPAVPGLTWLLQAASGAAGATTAGQQQAAEACEAPRALAPTASGAGEAGDEAGPVPASGSAGRSSSDADVCGSTAGLRQQLACICDVRDVGGDQYYRLNDERVMAWLRLKFRQAAAALAPQVAGMDPRSAAQYVVSVLEEYLPAAAAAAGGGPAAPGGWAARLADAVGAATLAAAGPAKRDAADAWACSPGAAVDAAPLHHLQPHDALPQQQQQPADKRPKAAPAAEPSRAQKMAEAKQATLAKHATGTKKIGAFFAKAAAPKT